MLIRNVNHAKKESFDPRRMWIPIILKYIFIQHLFLHCVESKDVEKIKVTICTTATTCGECIQLPECAWCKQEQSISERCVPKENLDHCRKEDVINPQHSTFIPESDPSLNNGENSNNDKPETAQLKPTRVKLRLRKDSPLKFKITFMQAEDYPVDLYYLMDFTFSMTKHKERVVEAIENIAQIMKNITKNVQLGFGSFVDKVAMPFVDMVSESLQNPCYKSDMSCARPYGFKNHLPLTGDTIKFKETVASASLSANLDDPEGGFDALMQATVCRKSIGWKKISRKIILFATASKSHSAGDGKLAGIVKPNDAKCYLNKEGYYTMSMSQDYPSVEQLNNQLSRNKVIVVFAVLKSVAHEYERLSELLEGAVIGVLENDSSNIVDLLREQYRKIRSIVELKSNAPDHIEIKFSSNCKEENKCEDVEVGSSIEFEVEVKATSCPSDPSEWNQTVFISPVGLNEFVQVDIELICQCDCEKPEFEERNSSRCSNLGAYKCGVCYCGDNRFGRECECTGNDLIKQEKLDQCKKGKSNRVCSGQGYCLCGQCTCPQQKDKNIFGTFCECDDYSCARDEEGKICGGEKRGMCCESQCVCRAGWSGSWCECSTDNSTCIAPGNQESNLICSGHGTCKCGQCICTSTDKARYGGQYCQDCPTCVGRCEEFKACVQCKAFQTSILSNEECNNCEFEIVKVETLDASSKDKRRCVFKDEDKCTFNFCYSYLSNNQLLVEVQEKRDCPREIPMAKIVGGIAGTVFVIGLLTILLFRIFVHVKDKWEFQQYQKALEKEKWAHDKNPLYKDPKQTFKNPMYRRNEDDINESDERYVFQ
ncbi:integrin beta-PS-like isoform X1 [Tachypleus tridentatus]|uniref:integrin beta-PS-like isoform X1 n=1 Tax=Tachypleus tridentatus TaxID=6853 RepID=UPI003FD40EE8